MISLVTEGLHLLPKLPAPLGGSWWLEQARDGFTARCETYFGSVLPCECTEVEGRILQQRADWLATVQAIRAARQTGALRRAVIVSNH